MLLKKIMKNFTLSLLLVLIINESSLAESPTINFDGYLKKVNVLSEDFTETYISRDRFRRSLGKTKQQIIAEFWKNYPDYFSKTLISIQSENYNGYELLSIGGILDIKHKAIFVLQSGVCIGYNINSAVGITSFSNDNRIIGIKSLPRNQGYLPFDLSRLNYIDSVNIYETTINTFVERYITIKLKGQIEFVLMYSFYPSSLESKFKPDIINTFDFNLHEIDNGNPIVPQEYHNSELPRNQK